MRNLEEYLNTWGIFTVILLGKSLEKSFIAFGASLLVPASQSYAAFFHYVFPLLLLSSYIALQRNFFISNSFVIYKYGFLLEIWYLFTNIMQ